MIESFPAHTRVTRRRLAQQQTRRRLIAAARGLIAERGYDAATLREVAALAGLSTGAVFANFADKADLFNAVVIADQAELLDHMRGLAGEAASPKEALLNMLAVGYALHFERLTLVKAQMGFSWVIDPTTEQRNRAGVRRIIACLSEVLNEGVRNGDFSADLDVAMIAEMAWESYVANYRRAIFDDWTLEALRERMAKQLDILLEGYERRAALRAEEVPARLDRSQVAMRG